MSARTFPLRPLFWGRPFFLAGRGCWEGSRVAFQALWARWALAAPGNQVVAGLQVPPGVCLWGL